MRLLGQAFLTARCLRALVLVMAVAVGGCDGGDQQIDGEEEALASGATAGEGDEGDRTPIPGNPTPTPTPATATPAETVTSHVARHCGGPWETGWHWEKLWEPPERHFLTWTASGRHLLVVDRATVVAIDVLDGSQMPVAFANRGPVEPAFGTFGSVADGRIVFATCLYSDVLLATDQVFSNLPEADPLNNTYELAVADLHLEENLQGEVSRVTRTPASVELYPSWDPDGKRFAYVVVDNEERDFSKARIHIAGSEGEVGGGWEGLRGIAMAPPQWSPNGRFLAVLVGEGEDFRMSGGSFPPDHQILYTIDLEEGSQYRVSEASGLPAWAPGGGAIAFGKGGDGDLALYVAGSDGADVRRVAPREGGFYVPEFLGVKEGRVSSGLQRDLQVSQVAWSPDGEHILVVVEERHFSNSLRNMAAIYVVKADGSDMWRLDLDHRLPASFRAAWSPDGKRIGIRVDVRQRNHIPFDYQSLQVLLTVAWDGTDAQVLIDRLGGFGLYSGVEVDEDPGGQ